MFHIDFEETETGKAYFFIEAGKSCLQDLRKSLEEPLTVYSKLYRS